MRALTQEAELRPGDHAPLHQRPPRRQHRVQARPQIALESRRRAICQRPRSQQAPNQAIPQTLEPDLACTQCTIAWLEDCADSLWPAARAIFHTANPVAELSDSPESTPIQKYTGNPKLGPSQANSTPATRADTPKVKLQP